MLNWVSPEHSQTDRGRQKAVNSAITNGTSKIIHPTQTVFQVNNCKKENHQVICMLPSHFFKCRLNTQTWTKRKRNKKTCTTRLIAPSLHQRLESLNFPTLISSSNLSPTESLQKGHKEHSIPFSWWQSDYQCSCATQMTGINLLTFVTSCFVFFKHLTCVFKYIFLWILSIIKITLLQQWTVTARIYIHMKGADMQSKITIWKSKNISQSCCCTVVCEIQLWA